MSLGIINCSEKKESYPECMEHSWKITLIGKDTIVGTMELYNYSNGFPFAGESMDATWSVLNKYTYSHIGTGYINNWTALFYINDEDNVYNYQFSFSRFDCDDFFGTCLLIRNIDSVIDSSDYNFKAKRM